MNDEALSPIGQNEYAADLVQRNEYTARLIEQNTVIIDLLETIAARQGAVTVHNFNMPFWALVGFLIKVSIAGIPALIVLGIIGAAISFLVGLVLASIGLMF